MHEPISATLTIVNKKGLHASAAGKFYKLAVTFDASLTVANENGSAPGDSIMDLLMLVAAQGTEITITAEGPEARAALASLSGLVTDGFGELETP